MQGRGHEACILVVDSHGACGCRIGCRSRGPGSSQQSARARAGPHLASDVSLYRSTGPRVKGFVQRRGGYSYKWSDTINTYGDSRTRYGSVNSYRDPNLDRQSLSGPFDHGFFFDSGMGRIGGSAPYMH